MFDESVFAGDKQKEFFATLKAGKDCTVVEIAVCLGEKRHEFIRKLNAEVSGVKINWLCIENEPGPKRFGAFGWR